MRAKALSGVGGQDKGKIRRTWVESSAPRDHTLGSGTEHSRRDSWAGQSVVHDHSDSDREEEDDDRLGIIMLLDVCLIWSPCHLLEHTWGRFPTSRRPTQPQAVQAAKNTQEESRNVSQETHSMLYYVISPRRKLPRDYPRRTIPLHSGYEIVRPGRPQAHWICVCPLQIHPGGQSKLLALRTGEAVNSRPPYCTINWRSTESPVRTAPLSDLGTAERALIDYIFGGGNCAVCGAWSLELPHSFALNWRSCSARCRKQVYNVKIKTKTLVELKASDMSRHPGARWVVCHETAFSTGLYVKSSLASAHAAMKQLCRGKPPLDQCYTFNSLERWKFEYLDAIKDTQALNLLFLKPIARQERRKLGDLLQSPTLLRVFEAFNRDLTVMGYNAYNYEVDGGRGIQACTEDVEDKRLGGGQMTKVSAPRRSVGTHPRGLKVSRPQTRRGRLLELNEMRLNRLKVEVMNLWVLVPPQSGQRKLKHGAGMCGNEDVIGRDEVTWLKSAGGRGLVGNQSCTENAVSLGQRSGDGLSEANRELSAVETELDPDETTMATGLADIPWGTGVVIPGAGRTTAATRVKNSPTSMWGTDIEANVDVGVRKTSGIKEGLSRVGRSRGTRRLGGTGRKVGEEMHCVAGYPGYNTSATGMETVEDSASRTRFDFAADQRLMTGKRRKPSGPGPIAGQKLLDFEHSIDSRGGLEGLEAAEQRRIISEDHMSGQQTTRMIIRTLRFHLVLGAGSSESELSESLDMDKADAEGFECTICLNLGIVVDVQRGVAHTLQLLG
ncbi:hypothetical protein B0H17DRAFT_1145707 [Mycena rosella]|uniref:Uncharacterized protein n=1 Tax=Mycena rosella TaxID=1033263 RepID=A0AAD7G5A5_MYCRO|nr:hypothetical protein B0H17DRAFT_1145707 [Mycena rosella]